MLYMMKSIYFYHAFQFNRAEHKTDLLNPKLML
jgi:hypothetical protein